ncbi:MAG: TetR/AcrR family transcriptional regulator [Rhodocyclales bacterium]|nr:TetR/AcrR family transcriptional regulator [Rhodocyclales bacterium]
MERLEDSKPDTGTASLEASVLLFARKHPQFGQAKVAHELNLTGQSISPSGVRYIWKKHDLETAYKRLKALESSSTRVTPKLTGSQLATLKRGDITRRLAQKSRAAKAGSEAIAPDERQDQILRAAAELFVKRGYGGTSIRDIAHQVGLLPGSVYHHFPSKEDLFVAIHCEGFRQLVIRSENAIRTEADPWQRLELACAVHIASAVAGDAIARITAIGLFAIHEDRLQKRLERDRKNYDQRFRKLVADLDLPGTTDRSIFRLALLGALNWTLIWYRPGKAPPRQIARELIRTFRGTA